MPRRAALLALCALVPTIAAAQGHEGHAVHAPEAPALAEPGQGAFAAISEVVARLLADPHTDWSRVDIGALRAHLVDMDRLVLDAAPEVETVEGGLRITVALGGAATGAAGRMVPAHAPVLAAETGWRSEAARGADAVVWTVTAPDAKATARIRALGFFGLMAVGDHHRAHHLTIATGGGH